MKKIVLLVLAVALMATSSLAQGLSSYTELLRSDIKTEKMAMITDVMQFTDAESEAFWPIYRDYQLELEKLGDKYIAVIRDYADNFTTLTDEKAIELTKRSIEIRKDRLDLQKKYFEKAAKVITPVRAARWAQLENQILMLLDLQVVSELPLAAKPAGQ